jgi:hypothetical protein
MTKRAEKMQHTELTEVTPEMAEDWLTSNTHNRTVRPAFVETYAADMLAGKWRLTHQGIAFDWDGVLIDGQHRLLAVLKAKRTVLMNVTRNMDPDALANIDGAIGRKVGDQFNLVDGHTDGRRLAATVSVIRDIESAFESKSTKLTFDGARSIYARHKGGVDWALSVFRSRKTFGAAPMTGAMAYAFPRDPGKAARFAEQVIGGEQLTRKDPAYTLRNFLLTTSGGRANERMLLSIITLRAFYAFAHNHELEVIKPALQGPETPAFQKTLAYFRRGHK